MDRRLGVQTPEDEYKEMQFLRQRDEQAQAAIRSQQSEHRRRSWCIIDISIFKLQSFLP